MFFLKELPTEAMVQKYTPHLSSDRRRSVVEALEIMRHASLLVRNIEAYFASHNLSQLRFLILIVIDREPDRDSLYAHEIASKLDVSRPVMTRTLQKLIEDELLTSSSDALDKRAKKITLTQKGKSRLVEILPGYFDQIMPLMS